MNEGNANDQVSLARQPLRQDILAIASGALFYFLAYQMAFLFPDAEKVLMAIWPAGGFGVAALLLNPRRLWPAIAAAFFVAGNLTNLLAGRSFIASIGFMTANIIESLGCAWLISRICGKNVKFESVKEVLVLIFITTLVNTSTTFIGAGTAHLTSGASFSEFWVTWWLAHGLGIVLITPLLVTWAKFQDWLPSRNWNRELEWAVFMILWCVVTWLSFNAITLPKFFTPQPYMLAILLVWPALRFGQRGVTLALLILTVIAITIAVLGAGPSPLGGGNPTERLLMVQVFLGIIAVSGYLLSASYMEAKAAEQASREDQVRLRALGDNLPNGIVYQVVRETDGNMRFLYVSASSERLNGVSAEVVLHDPSTIYNQIIEEDRAMFAAAEVASAKEMSVFKTVVRILRKDGQIRWMQIASSPRRLADGRILWDGIQIDITELVLAEQQVKKALAEKETLLRELYHRTKNNMQVISGLLDLQAMSVDDERLRAAFADTKNRIHSMALVHQKLYDAKDLSHINLKEYISDLTKLLMSSYRISPSKLSLVSEMEDVFVLIDTAIPCGLVINEVISNALLHAFPDGRDGEIRVQLHKTEDGEIQLCIADNGVGAPPGFDFRKNGHLGLRNIFLIGEAQLRGQITFSSENGVKCEIRFRDNAYKARV